MSLRCAFFAPRGVGLTFRQTICLPICLAPWLSICLSICLAICLASPLAIASPASPKPASPTLAGAASLSETADPSALLRRFRDNTLGTQTLSTQFHQQKTMSLMAETLEAEGRLCVRQTPQGLTLLWEYTAPTVSGFIYDENAPLRLWMRDRAAIRSATDRESGLLKAMSEQILTWLRTDPEALSRQYHLEFLPAKAASGSASSSASGSSPSSDSNSKLGAQALPQGVGLVPKRGKTFFSRLEVRFDPNLTRLHSLRLVEKEGDSTLLLFFGEARNAPLPDFCQP